MIKPVLQNEVTECGLACVVMIANEHGIPISLLDLRRKYKISKDGISLYQMIQILSEFDIDSTPLSGSYTELKNLSVPAILFWNKSHFVVLESVKDDFFSIIDPAFGRRTYSLEEMQYYFSGVALEVSKNPVLAISKHSLLCREKDKEKKFQAKKQSFSLKGLFYRYPWVARNLILLFVIATGVHVFSLASPKLFSLTIDEVVTKNDTELLYLILYIFSALFFMLTAFNYLRSSLNKTIRKVIETDLSSSFINYLSKLPLEFFEKRSPASILRKSQALDSLYNKFTSGWFDIASDIIFAIVFLLLMGFVNPKLALLSFILCSSFIIYRVIIVYRIEEIQKKTIEQEVERNSVLLSMIGEMRTAKLYGYTSAKASEWSALQRKAVDFRATMGFVQENNKVIYSSVSNMQALLISGLGALAVLSGDNTIGDIFSFVLYKDLFLQTTLNIVDKYMVLRMTEVEMDRLDDVLETEPEILHPKGTTELSVLSRSDVLETIVLRDISYSYGSFEDYVVKNINLEIKSGDHIAIIGKSGSGKSTLLNIISSLYEVSEGGMYINGKTLSSFGIKHYRERISYIGAGNEIISGNVFDNITMYSEAPSSDLDWLYECLKKACIYDEVMKLPAGIHTRLGVGGFLLSSGQIQRLLIARALYRKPDLMILDEPTAHLDSSSKEIVLESIRLLPCSVLLVTHDDYVRNYMDKTLSMTNGELS